MSTVNNIRFSAVAGMFYPADPFELHQQVEEYLEEDHDQEKPVPKALIVPHAGYIYSGKVAAAAYKRIKKHKTKIRKVVLLGPVHRVSITGIALPTATVFQTPLGSIHLESQQMVALVDNFAHVIFSDLAHAEEHSLEVHLPFLQTVLDEFQLIPLVIGNASGQEVANVINHLWGDDECLIIVSSDLSHFLSYEKAVALDRATANSIEAFDGNSLRENSACGRIPIKGLLQVARQRKLSIERFNLINSGDTAGDREQVVGYGAWGLFES